MSRANLNSSPPHQAHGHPNFARVDGQIPIHSLGYSRQQVERGHFVESSPVLAPQPAGAADTESCVWCNGQGEADMPSNGRWSGEPFEGHGAFTREISEPLGGEGAEAFIDVGYVGCVNESGLSPWTALTAAAGEYGAQGQQEFLLGDTYGAQSAQSSYEPWFGEYIEQDGRGGEFEFCQS